MIARDWFVTRDFIDDIKAELMDAVGYGPKKFDRDIEQALDALDAKTVGSLVFILGRALLLTKRIADRKQDEEDAAQTQEDFERACRLADEIQRRAPFDYPPQRVL